MKLFTLLFITVAVLYSASFDCKKASSTIEKTICSESSLSKLDDHLGRLYSFIKENTNTDEFNNIKFSQRTWLKDRNSCAKNIELLSVCLHESYRNRQSELRGIVKKIIQNKINNLHKNPSAIIKLTHEIESPLIHLYAAYIYNKGLLGKPNYEKSDIEYKKALNFVKKHYINRTQSDENAILDYLSKVEFNNSFDDNLLSNIEDTYKSNQLNGITTFIFAIHFTENTEQCIPNYAIGENWEGRYIGTYGGTSSAFLIKAYCPIPKEKSFFTVPTFVKLIDTLSDMYGKPGVHICTGSIEYYKQAQLDENFKLAQINPFSFEKLEEPTRRDIEKYLKLWSSYGIWNYYTYKNYKEDLLIAKKDLALFYMKNFNINKEKAKKTAEIVIENLLVHYVGSFSRSEEYGPLSKLKDPLIKLYMQKNISIANIENLGQLNKAQLNSLLKLMLLKNSNKEIIEYLIDNGAKINNGEESALFYALGNSNNVKLLIDKYNADVNYKNCFNKTPIFSAIQIKNLNSVKVLLKRNANINQKTKSLSGYETSCEQSGCFNISTSKRTPLMYAAWQGNKEIIEFLINNNADLNMLDSNKHSVYHYLKKNKSLSEKDKQYIVKLLKKKTTDKQFLKKSCNDNNMVSCYNLGYLYSEEGNQLKAKELYTKACNGKVVRACYNLALLYYKGDGVEKNYKKACKLFKTASENGSENAKIWFDRQCKGYKYFSKKSERKLATIDDITYYITYNKHGAVITNDNDIGKIYIGKSCDIYSKYLGSGTWKFTGDGPFIVKFNGKPEETLKFNSSNQYFFKNWYLFMPEKAIKCF